jgi:kumamolisin
VFFPYGAFKTFSKFRPKCFPPPLDDDSHFQLKINNMSSPRITLSGSERKPIPKGKPPIGIFERPDPHQFIEITLKLRPKAEFPTWVIHTGTLSHDQVKTDYGTAESDFKAIRQFAREYRLQVLDENHFSCTAKLSGTLQDLENAFQTRLRHVQVGAKVFRERTGHLALPDYVSMIVQGVFGLDNREQVKPHIRPSHGPRTAATFTPLQVAKLYDFPGGDGTGQTIALLEFGGGYTIAELNEYFADLGLTTPNITPVLLPGAQNLPTPTPVPTQDNPDPPDPDAEVLLDIEIAGAVAPKATIKVYFAKDASDKSFVDCIDQAIEDKPSVISISWGGPESTWTASALKTIDQSLQRAASLGINVTVASGDNGSTDGTSPAILDVDFPSSSPHALACGGTRLVGTTGITSETVWNSEGGATGGGVSSNFARPSYQANANVPAPSNSGGGRGVPDVSGDADPDTGYVIQWDGKTQPVGGTSAVAPLWAGLIARLGQNLGHNVPFLNPILYDNTGAMHDITNGSNDLNGMGKYSAGPGWDACTGLGSPDGQAVLNAVSGSVAAPPHPTPSHTITHPHPPAPTHTHPPKPTHTQPHPHPPTPSTGQTGSTGEARALYPLPVASEPMPVQERVEYVEEEKPQEMTAPAMMPGDYQSEGIVAIVGMVSNVANTAIAALTAISTQINKNA